MAINKTTVLHAQDEKSRKNISGFHATSMFAQYPVIGLLMFIFGVLAFSGLTLNLLFQGPLLAVDNLIANTLPAIALKGPPFVKVIMVASYYVGNELLTVLAFLLGFYFIYKRYWQQLVMLFIGLAGSSVFFLSLSKLIDRPRPPTQIWLVLNIPGFPSGHASAVIVFYGLMAYLLVSNIYSNFWKAIIIITTISIIAFVGFSRIFTGGHYLTDVLAGYSIEIAWSGLVYTLVEIYFQKRTRLNVKKR